MHRKLSNGRIWYLMTDEVTEARDAALHKYAVDLFKERGENWDERQLTPGFQGGWNHGWEAATERVLFSTVPTSYHDKIVGEAQKRIHELENELAARVSDVAEIPTRFAIFTDIIDVSSWELSICLKCGSIVPVSQHDVHIAFHRSQKI